MSKETTRSPVIYGFLLLMFLPIGIANIASGTGEGNTQLVVGGCIMVVASMGGIVVAYRDWRRRDRDKRDANQEDEQLRARTTRRSSRGTSRLG